MDSPGHLSTMEAGVLSFGVVETMLTLNIIAHELHSCGHVVRTQMDNPSYFGFRLFIKDDSLVAPDVLYLCGTRADVSEAVQQGCPVIYVNSSDSTPDNRAVLSVLQGESVLVVFNALLDAASRFDKWEREMDSVRLRGGELQELLDISTPFLRNNVVIVDPSLKLLAYTKDVPCDDPITVELITHGYHTEENISKFKLHKRFKPWADEEGFIVNDSFEICKYVTVVRSFKTKSSFSIIIIMMCNVVDPDDYLLDVYDLFAQRVEYFALRDYPDDKPSGNAVDTFLKDLFLGKAGNDEAIRERGRIAGIPNEARFCLFYIREPEGTMPKSRILSDVSRLVAPAKTTLVGDAVVVLCFNCRSKRCALHCAANSCPLGHTSLSSRLNDMMERFNLICGRSSKFAELSSAPAAFEQARIACEIGWQKTMRKGKLSIPHNWSRVVSFDSCIIDYMIGSFMQKGGELIGLTYAGYVLESIRKQDSSARTDNYVFLYEYLMNERRTSVVAEKLHMHRNNVKYRIDRIESQFGIDTNDPTLRFNFLLAYRIREAMLVQSAQAIKENSVVSAP